MTVNDPVYVLGAGFVGSLVAYELSTLKPAYDIVLLLRSEEKVLRFEENGCRLTVHQAPTNITRTMQAKASSPPQMAVQGSRIRKLVVATKTYQTKSALSDYLDLITPETEIVFIQNGLGVIDILHQEVWSDVASRPKIYQGVTNHGGFKTPDVADEFHFTHAGFGDLKIAKVPNDVTDVTTASALAEGSAFIRELARPKILNTVLYEYSELLVVQIEKFAVNACINAITSIVDCVNGELETLESTEDLFRSIIQECIDVFFVGIPALQRSKRARQVLDVDRLVKHVINVGTVVNARNSSSMRQDCLNLRTTEIDFINGYVVKLAKEHGLAAEVNRTVSMLVRTRLALNRARAGQ